ncbi:MAG: hypothetical protein NTX00_03090 [Candidatus Parcubacteria bacterium]|nr:hypothetical protein [Candidatus Parcubacteria bacterium]
MAYSEQKNSRTERVVQKEQPKKIENVSELAEQRTKSLKERMGGPGDKIIGPAVEMIEGISLKGVDTKKINPKVLESLKLIPKSKSKPAGRDIWGQENRLAM